MQGGRLIGKKRFLGHHLRARDGFPTLMAQVGGDDVALATPTIYLRAIHPIHYLPKKRDLAIVKIINGITQYRHTTTTSYIEQVLTEGVAASVQRPLLVLIRRLHSSSAHLPSTEQP